MKSEPGSVALEPYVQLSFRTSTEQADAITALARKHQRNLSGEIRMAIDAWVERCAAEESPQS